MATTVLFEKQGHVGVIRINRPEVANAINAATGRALYETFKQVETDGDIRAVVLTGAGRAFCAGQDLRDEEAMASAAHLGNTVRERYNILIAKMQALPMPVIAAVNGAAAGAGFGLALACDLRIASADAKFTMAFSKIGLAPDSGTSYFLPRLVGVAKALELAWTADVLTAQQALELGVVNQVVPGDQLLEQTLAFAERLGSGPTLAYALTKQAMYANVTANLADALEREAQLQETVGGSHDFIEGVQAFLEKRPPRYTGV